MKTELFRISNCGMYVEVSWDGGLDEISGCASNPKYNFGHWSIMKLWNELTKIVDTFRNGIMLPKLTYWEKIVQGKLLKFEAERWIFKIFEIPN